jgi:hypothetical protein
MNAVPKLKKAFIAQFIENIVILICVQVHSHQTLKLYDTGLEAIHFYLLSEIQVASSIFLITK